MNILYITYPLNGLLMISIPIGLAIWLTRRLKLGWGLWFIGAAIFIISQVGHIPFNIFLTRLFQSGTIPRPPADWLLPVNAAILGLSAGLWEESARYAMFRWWTNDARTWRKGVLAGAGHGGMEAILLGGLVLFAFFQLAGLRDVDLVNRIPAAQIALVQQQINAYWSASWYDSLLGAVERIFAIILQISLSVLVLQVFIRRQSRWFWLAVIFHALVDAVAVISVRFLNIYQVEAVIGLFALVGFFIIYKFRESDQEIVPLPDTSKSPKKFIPRQLEETPENLEDSRFQ